MKVLFVNLLLALAWTFLKGSFALNTIIEGFLIGYLLLWLTRPLYGGSSYFSKIQQVISFLGFFVRELIVASLRVAYDVITPQNRMRPAIIAVPLDVESDAEITLLANLISLTPGTLTLDISDDRRTIYIHAMYVRDVETFRSEIKQGFERRVRELMQ